ncbi:hypothetical protein EV195_104157 [Tenacibaculum skagerrakense]|uniref:Uncharacterized protein n=1 Tax=Tenacibaculum skagerrakense TaxID=186571 RepID=A0A4R2NUD6_9FLAO|nr:hypothetical protein [Tenacibaculum skagerrakense]TCP25124.1 hypothetical protein EV195_104157 [Tenacibaculum skagerrakense]
MKKILEKKHIRNILIIVIILIISIFLINLSKKQKSQVDKNIITEIPKTEINIKNTYEIEKQNSTDYSHLNLSDDIENTFYVANDNFIDEGLNSLSFENIKELYPLINEEMISLKYGNNELVLVATYGDDLSWFKYVIGEGKTILWQAEISSDHVIFDSIRVNDHYSKIYRLLGIEKYNKGYLSVSNLEGGLEFLLSFDINGLLEKIEYQDTYLH